MATDTATVGKLRELLANDIVEYEKEVGKSLPDDLTSDIRFTRFISAYDGDVEGAATAYRNMLAWRKEANVEELRSSINVNILKQSSFPHWEVVQEVGETGPWYLKERSFQGDLIQLEVLGKVPPAQLIETVTPTRILEHQIGFFETRSKVLDDFSKEDKLVRTLQVRDLSKFNLGLLQHTKALTTVRAIMKTGSLNYPESTSKAIFVNTPISFVAFWKGLSVVLRKKTQDKVVILGPDYHKDLLKLVPARAIHRLEKMRCEKHVFPEDGEEEIHDHHPLLEEHTVVVPAGKTLYQAIWLCRTGHRSEVIVSLKGTEATPQLPKFKLSFLATKDGVVSETNLPTEVYATNEPDQYKVQFPELLPEGIDDGFLLIDFDNTVSWVYSVTVNVTAEFHEKE